MREATRINPGIAMILERLVPTSGLTLADGRFIPAGTKVGINPAVTNRDQAVFGEDANDFNPDRWLRKDEEDQASFEVRLRKMRDVADHTFGGGSRICMGRYLAQLELWKLFATLYSVFDVGAFLPGFYMPTWCLPCLPTLLRIPAYTTTRRRSNYSIPITFGNITMPGSYTNGIYR